VSAGRDYYAALAREVWRARCALRNRPHDHDGRALRPHVAITIVAALANRDDTPALLRRGCLDDTRRFAPLALRQVPRVL
jgi:hypothetical protein